ncbi:MAG: NAD(P)/FAD-dependent oxidoreductase [Polyangiaceae bacterium]|nr:NAD(P)/FAD-dependent oxidoreductase [Polyangiaceae bacterium]
MNTQKLPHVRIAILGSGFGGLGAAIRLAQAGERDFVILERADDVGGCWRDNTYPGCACDVPSHLYSYSFAANPDWSRAFAPQDEIWNYLKDCAARFGILPHVRFGHDVLAATWNESEQHWSIDTSKGTLTANIVISALGPLCEPAIPKLRGIETFQGEAFHSARWNHDYDLRGRRVAVIGTGASAIQFVPQIQPQVSKLYLLQRTPPWILPRQDHAIGTFWRRLYRAMPWVQRLARAAIFSGREIFVLGFLYPSIMKGVERMARAHLEKQVTDPELRQKLLPNYRIGTKRILLSNDYYPSLAQENVEVMTDVIKEVTPHGIVTESGKSREIDAILYGTGFIVTDPPIAKSVRGRDGLLLANAWKGSPKAYLGTTVAGFPNLFFLLGPNSGLGHSSVLYMEECQIHHVLETVRYMRDHNVATVEPKQYVQDAYVRELDRKSEKTVWLTGGTGSYYIDATGRNSTIWPGYSFAYQRRLERFVPGDYVLTPAKAGQRVSPSTSGAETVARSA